MSSPETLEVVVAQLLLELPPPPVPQAEALADTVPSELTWRQRVDAPPRPETMRLVVEAVVAVMAVVEAYGRVEALVEVAVIQATVGEVEETKAPESLMPSHPWEKEV